jgi:hypothetical protein
VCTVEQYEVGNVYELLHAEHVQPVQWPIVSTAMWLPSRKHRKIIQHSFVVPGRHKSVGSVTSAATSQSVRKRKSTSIVVPNDAGSSSGGAVGAGVRRKSILTAISDGAGNDISSAAATGKHAATPKQGILLVRIFNRIQMFLNDTVMVFNASVYCDSMHSTCMIHYSVL